MDITVAICTWNRAGLLDLTLERLCAVGRFDGNNGEVIVVDNNCTDHTPDIIRRYQQRLPLRRVVEAQQGLNCARNRALAEAQSDWVLFTDDDVLVSEVWLTGYLAAIQVADERLALLGGPVEPWFEVEPTPELAAGIPIVAAGLCGIRAPERLEIDATTTHLPFGANFAVRKSRLQSLQFRPELGPIGGTRIAGDEIVFMKALLANGSTGRWLPDALVKHYVPRHRITTRYLRGHLYGIGRAIGREMRAQGGAQWRPPLWMYRDVAETACLLGLYWASGQRQRYYERFSRMWQRLGILAEAYSRST